MSPTCPQPKTLSSQPSLDVLITEARAKIIWGDAPQLVHTYLTFNGMSPADADATINQLVRERKAEIRKLGIRDLLIGALVLGAVVGYFYSVFSSSRMPNVSVRAAKGTGVLALIGFYGLWRLVMGISRLLRPSSEPRSVSDMPG